MEALIYQLSDKSIWDFAHQHGDEYLLTGWRGNRRVRERYHWHREALLQPIDDGSLWLLRNGERKLLARTAFARSK